MALYRLFQRLVTIAVVIGVVISAGGSHIFAGDGPYAPAQAPQQTGLQLIESDDPLVQREGSWTTQTTAGASGGSYLYNTGSLNDVLTLNFIGSTFEIVYVGGPTLGMIALEVDGTVINTPSMYAQSTLYGQRISVNYLPAGSHTLRVYEQENSLITVDAFYAEISTSGNNPTCPSELSIPYEDIVAFRNAINLANSNPDVTTICLDGGYTFTNAATGADALPIITTEIIIEGNGVTLTRSGIGNLRFYEIAATGRLTLRDQILLSGSVTGNGGGILNNGGSLTLDNVWLHMGHANGNGAGIYSNGGSLQIQGSTFASNTAANGAGLYTTSGTSTTITHTTFADNSATQDGGALYNAGTLTVVLGGFANNSAGRYGGAISNLGTATLNASIFDANTAVTRGGAINNQGTLTLTGNTLVYHNTATGGTASGGGVYSATGSQLTLRYTVVTENTAANGGGVRSEGTLSVESNTEFTLNQATQQGGALYIGDGNVTITNTRILSNTAGTNGGAIFNASTTDSFSFSDSLVQENYATVRGGGFYSAGPLAIEHSNLHSNGAGTQGGGIYLTAASNASAHNSCIVENSTPNAVHNAGTTARSFTNNWWGAADGPSGVGSGSGDAVSTYITYTGFLSNDSPCASTLPPLPPTLSCQSWQDGLAYGWTDSSSGGPYVVWDTNGMYGNASGTGTWTVSTYYDVSSLTPAADTWYFRFTDNGLGDDYEVYQGPAAPAPGTILGSLVAQNPDGFYNITEDFVQLVWSVETPLNLSASLQFFSFCSTTQPPIPNRGPIVNAGLDQVLILPDMEAQLAGQVTDQDTLPGTGVTAEWQVVSGPGTVSFNPPLDATHTDRSTVPTPLATFSAIGVYVLRLTGSDGLLSATDDVTIVVSNSIDLAVQSVNADNVAVDPQTLLASGTVSAEIANLGEMSTSLGFMVTFFEDTPDAQGNYNGLYDVGVDTRLGEVQRPALAGGTTVTISTPAAGEVAFPGVRIYAFVDSTNTITELTEANNIGHSGDACVAPPINTNFNATLEWQWNGVWVPGEVLADDVVMTPAVADLDPTDTDPVPTIMVIAYYPFGDPNIRWGTLVGLQGDGLTTVPEFVQSQYLLDPRRALAVGNLDADPQLEIVAVYRSAQGTNEVLDLIAFDSPVNGTLPVLWQNYGGAAPAFNPAIADLNGDGQAEILSGASVYDGGTGELLWVSSIGGGDESVAADLDLDGRPELVTGNKAFSFATDSNGNFVLDAQGDLTVASSWEAVDPFDTSRELRNGRVAIGNFDSDLNPEIVFLEYNAFYNSGLVYVLEHNGIVKETNEVPWVFNPNGLGTLSSDALGAPVVGNFDNDPAAEIGVAGEDYYFVLDTDGGLEPAYLPAIPINDQSSAGNGSVAFDFNDDGIDEIVYTDETHVAIFDAATGTRLWYAPAHSPTHDEYPVVADVDNDGHAEIVAIREGMTIDNVYYPPVWIYGNDFDSAEPNDTGWADTRSIWNQYSYHITNINDDGSIPTHEVNGWQAYNTYRGNPVINACAVPAHDLAASYVRKVVANGQTTITARIGNSGNTTIPASVVVGFYDNNGSVNPHQPGNQLASVTTATTLQPGDYEDVSWVVPTEPTPPIASPLWVWVDSDNQYTEDNEANNQYRSRTYLTATPNEPPTVDAGPDQTITLPVDTVTLSGVGQDDGQPLPLTYQWRVMDAPIEGMVTFGNSTSASTTAEFNLAGIYTLRLYVEDGDYRATSIYDELMVTVIGVPLPSAQTPGLIGSPANGSSLTGVVPITLLEGATITSATLEMWPAYNPNAVTTLATNLSANGGETLATLDTTRLSNDSYFIRLVGTDGTSQETHSIIMVTAVGENKPGRVKFTVTDLVVPVSGLPITIGRTYDSLERNLSGDFGYGWSLAIGNPRLEIDGHQNVTLTMPDGRRTTFYFTPQPMGLVFSQPHYTPEPGVYGSLTVPDCLLVSGGETGYICFLEGPFEPQTYTYTDPYGRVFTLDRDGTLQSIRDLNDNVLTFTENGISSNAGSLSVLFQRDAQGRITQIIDPAGNVYGYTYGTTYDPSGDLTRVTLPTVGSTVIDVDYTYGTGNLAHYFLTAQDPRGTIAATMAYYTDPQDQANYGRLQQVTDAGGNVTHYAYDLANNTTTITNPDNGVVRIHYDALGYVLEETNPLNQTTHYTYDENHNLRAETNHLGQTTSYDYNDQGHRTSVTNALGQQVITIAYNQYGGPTTLTDALGQLRNIQYDLRFNPSGATDNLNGPNTPIGGYTWNLQGNPTSYTNGDGETTSYTYNAYGQKVSETNAEGETTSYTYDLFGRTLSVTNAENETTAYTYDALGRMRTVTDPLGHITQFEYDQNGNRTAIVDPLNRRTEYTYNLLNQVTTVRYADLTTTTYAYDWRGSVTHITDATNRHTRYGYDQAGRRTSMTVAADTPSAGTTFYFYDGAGRLEREQDPLGHSTIYTYDPVGRLTRVTDALGHHTDYGYDAINQQVSVTDANTYTTSYEYDIRGRLRFTHNPDTTVVEQRYDGAGRVTRSIDETGRIVDYTYDNVGRMLTTTVAPNTADALTTAYEYDNAGRQTAVIVDPTGIHSRTAYTYLDNGQIDYITDPLTNVTNYDYDQVGQRTAVTNANGYTTNFEYDTRGQLIHTIYPAPTGPAPFGTGTRPFTETVYDDAGRVTSRIDEMGRTTTYGYDYAGRLASVANALPATTSYTYDLAGNLWTITDANNHTITMTYDELNRLYRKTWPEGSYEQYGYDAMGNVTSHRLTDTNVNTFNYTNRGWLDHAIYFDGITYDYDYQANGLRYGVIEQQGSTTLSTKTYTFDAQGRTTGMSIAGGQSISYTYDPVGNRASMTTPAGTTTYGYDDAFRLTSVTDPQTQTTTLTYNAVNSLTRISYPNGVFADHTYDNRDGLTNIVQYSDPQFPLASYAYTLDGVGNRTGVVEGDGTSLTWGYDAAYRLTSEQRLVSGTPVYSAAYEYDPVGNRTEQTVNGQVTIYAYNNLDQMTSAGNVAYSYDGRGNLHQMTDGANITTFNYDARDRLASVTLPDTTNIAYVYDAEGHRVRESVGTEVTNYLWDELSPYGDVVLESDGSGTPLTSYVLAHTRLLSQRQNNSTHYYLSDGQNNVRGLTDAIGGVTDTYTYTAFGELYNSTGTTDNAYLYTGQQFDELTGLYSLRARYYNPTLGRFQSRDTYAVDYNNPLELNRYVHAANNSINSYDPTGLFSISDTVQKIRQDLEAAISTGQLGTNLAYMYTRVGLNLLKWMPWIQRATCFVGGVFIEGPDIPSCEFVPDVDGPKIYRTEQGNFASEAVGFLRRVAKKLGIFSGDGKNIGLGRIFLPNRPAKAPWAISGFIPKLETFLENVGQQVAKKPGSRFIANLDAGKAPDMHSEIKIAEYFADAIEEALPKLDPDFIGPRPLIRMEIFTERHPCISCGGVDGVGGVMRQLYDFARQYGDVDLRIYYSRPYDGRG